MEIALEAIGNGDTGLNAAPFPYPIRIYNVRDS